ncbi:hypothetical protein [Tabrizicola sp.]|uniref:hypothetical protein n=1 Tax=Tabrizicola sp. TaxID=2005166 RepID=UPI00286CF32F|nr:hypothetical protein [Tabrizicola sp.]
MRHWLSLASYHWAALFAALALFAAILAWVSFGLINLAMANVDFLRHHGVMAIREGGLLQLTVIGAKALLALISYLCFKAIEAELIHRWRALDR